MRTKSDGTPRCQDCAEPPEPGASRCSACAKRHREAEAERSEARRNHHKCVTCGASAAKGKRYCQKHLAYYAERMRG